MAKYQMRFSQKTFRLPHQKKHRSAENSGWNRLLIQQSFRNHAQKTWQRFDRTQSLSENSTKPLCLQLGANNNNDSEPEMLSRVEAVLFLSQDPVPSRRLSQLADIPEGTRIRALVRKLNTRYDDQPCAFRVYEVAGGFQLRTRPQFAPWLRQLHDIPVEVRLSTSAMETLAIIVYKQPVLRATIEKIRGTQCGEILRQLMEQDLVKIVGKTNDLGRPFLYGVSRRFFQIFGLNRLEELP